MRKLNLLAILAVVAMVFSTSCSKDEKDKAEDLLKTIPSKSGLVAVANMQGMLEKAGCTVKGDEIELSSEIRGLINNIGNKEAEEFVKSVLEGEAGIDMNVVAAFEYDDDMYMTGHINDKDKFEKAIQDAMDTKFHEKKDGIKVAKIVAYKGDQFWVTREIETGKIKKFLDLDKDKSMVEVKSAKTLGEMEHDVMVWGNITSLLNFAQDIRMSERGAFQIMLSALFKDAEDFLAYWDFEEGAVKAELKVMNKNGEPAEYLMSNKPIEMSAFNELGGTADMVGAISITSDMISHLIDNFGAMIGIPAEVVPMLKSIGGTTVFSYNNDEYSSDYDWVAEYDYYLANGRYPQHEFSKVVIGTNGQYMDMVEEFASGMGLEGKMRTSGTNVVFDNGPVNGSEPVSQLGSQLKGSVAGVAVSNGFFPREARVVLAGGSLALYPDDKGVVLKMEVKSTKKDVNFLKAVLSVVK